jgi:hypothetical protein
VFFVFFGYGGPSVVISRVSCFMAGFRGRSWKVIGKPKGKPVEIGENRGGRLKMLNECKYEPG